MKGKLFRWKAINRGDIINQHNCKGLVESLQHYSKWTRFIYVFLYKTSSLQKSIIVVQHSSRTQSVLCIVYALHSRHYAGLELILIYATFVFRIFYKAIRLSCPFTYVVWNQSLT